MTKPSRFSLVSLLFWLAVAYSPGILGAAFGPDEWYRKIAKPAWTPPDWLFGPVWMTLYLLIGVATYRVARRGDHPAMPAALAWFFGQVVLNALWSPLFFGLHRPDLALVCVAGLWLTIVEMMRAYHRVRRGSALLLAPYLLWVSFAAALNGAIWYLNR